MRGMVIRGQWHTIEWVKDNYLCRRCHARFGKPWAHPIKGELDFSRLVCANEHEIKEEGDLISAKAVAVQEAQSIMDKIEVMGNYGHEVKTIADLYGDKNWEGF